MIAFLGLVLTNWRGLLTGAAIAGVLVGGFLAVEKIRSWRLGNQLEEVALERDAARRDAAIYAEVNRRNAESFRRYVAESEHGKAAVAAAVANSAARDRALARIIEELDNEPTADWRAPLSPGLSATLERLLELERSAGAGD